jgi:hypothetical protein
MPATAPATDLVTLARLAAMRDGRALAGVLARTVAPPDTLVDALARHTLVTPVLMALDAAEAWSEVPAGLAGALEPWRRVEWPAAGRLLALQTRVIATLVDGGVPVIALKGLCFAQRLYGGIGKRPQFDLDLLVRADDFGHACTILRRSGARPSGYDAHSRGFQRDGVKIDLHDRLTRAPAFRLDEAVSWRCAVDTSLGGVTVRTLSDEWALVQLLHAAYEDLGQGMAKLRQLMDAFLLVRNVDATFDWDAFFDARRTERFDGVALNVLALMTTLFDGAVEWPRLAAAIERRSASLLDTSARQAHFLLAAPRKHPASFQWFASLYPGSIVAYLVWFWYHGFPANTSPAALARLGRAVPEWLGRSAAVRKGDA